MGYRFLRLFKHIFCATVAGLLLVPLAQAQDLSLKFIGEQVIPHDHPFEGTTVGGLSALEYDAGTGRYIAICDDRSDQGPARFYGLKLGYDAAGFHNWQISDVHTMKQPDGSVFPGSCLYGRNFCGPRGPQVVTDAQQLFLDQRRPCR